MQVDITTHTFQCLKYLKYTNKARNWNKPNFVMWAREISSLFKFVWKFLIYIYAIYLCISHFARNGSLTFLPYRNETFG